MPENKLDINTLESWLWEAACKIRGAVDAPKYKDYILPLIFIKRLSDVFEDELEKEAKDFGGLETAEQLLQEDHSLVRFYIPKKARWESIKVQTTNVGEYLTDAVRAIARENVKLQGVIDGVDFNATSSGQRNISDEKIKMLIDVLGKYRLGLNDVEPDIFGRVYEYLLRKFAEGSGQSAGEFYTPREIAILMSYILDPEPNMTIYDPCAGSSGLLIKCQLRFKEKYKDDSAVAPLRFSGQEILASTFAMAKMNIFIHDMEADIYLGDTMVSPKTTSTDGSLQKYDLVTANPMWNQDFSQDTYENDTYNRFNYGYPPSNTADWGWIQHMYACLNDRGKMVVVLDTGAVARGSGNVGRNRERDIRKEFVEQDLVEAVILMPENLFYNTTAPGIILVINKNKNKENEVLLINASNLFKKGKPKNYLPDENINQISGIYLNWKDEEGISKIISKEEIVKNDYNLSPSRYVAQNGDDDSLPLEDAVVLLKDVEEERKQYDKKVKSILEILGFKQ
ncbi:Type I restriction enzyme EcoKI M protein [subsurface metagenome]